MVTQSSPIPNDDGKITLQERAARALPKYRLWNERTEEGRFILTQIDWISRLESGETLEKERTPIQKEFHF